MPFSQGFSGSLKMLNSTLLLPKKEFMLCGLRSNENEGCFSWIQRSFLSRLSFKVPVSLELPFRIKNCKRPFHSQGRENLNFQLAQLTSTDMKEYSFMWPPPLAVLDLS